MRIINPSFQIEEPDFGPRFLKRLETFGRVCYKSEKKVTLGSAKKFVGSLIAREHESVIEHEKITVRIICDRGVSHEIVRHRLGSYSQESTRYCNYGNKGVVFILPFFFKGADSLSNKKYRIWFNAMREAERAYLYLLKLGATPQEARSVLPNSLKTEIIVTYNLREWRHFLRLRTAKAAHPQMREITAPLLREFQKRIPIVFDDIIPYGGPVLG